MKTRWHFHAVLKFSLVSLYCVRSCCDNTQSMWMRNKGVTYMGHKHYFLRYSHWQWEPHLLSGWRSGSLLPTSAEGEFGLHFPFQKLLKKSIKTFEKCVSTAEQNRLQRVAKELSGFQKCVFSCKRHQIIQWFPSLNINWEFGEWLTWKLSPCFASEFHGRKMFACASTQWGFLRDLQIAFPTADCSM